MSSAKKSCRTVYIDGASRGNPGAAAAAAVFVDMEGKPCRTLSKPLGVTTNNVAEYCALILALQEALFMDIRELEVYTDSELVARQFSGQYKVKEPSIKVLHLLASHLRGGFKSLSVVHVPRERNKLADLEANRALDRGGELF